MNVEEVKVNIGNITTSKLRYIAETYNVPSVYTSRVAKLLTALDSIDFKNKRLTKGRKYKNDGYDDDRYDDFDFAEIGSNQVTDDEILDMIDTLKEGIEHYKKKYKVRSFPRDLTQVGLVDALSKLSPADIIKEVISSPKEAKKTTPTKKKKPIQKGRIEYNGDIKSQMIIDALKNI